MESNREKATKALLSRFTYYSQSEINDIIRLLDLAKGVDILNQTESSVDDNNVRQILNLFKSYYSYKNLIVSDEMLSVAFDPENLSTDLLFYLSLLEYNIANRIRNLSTDVFASSAIRAKTKIPKILSFKGYVLTQYECEGDYARYMDYLFFGCGRSKENPSENTVIFFRATKNQIKEYFGIEKVPEIGSYLDFTNDYKGITVNEEAFIDWTDNFDGRSIPLSALWGGRK